MSIVNEKSKTALPHCVITADNFITRMIGLLGLSSMPVHTALHLKSSGTIHTIGMKFPIDVIFLDKYGKILKKLENIKPNRIYPAPSHTASVLEFAAGQIQHFQFEAGDPLHIVSDEKMLIKSAAVSRITHWPINLFLGAIWGNLVVRNMQAWLFEKSITSLGLLAVNTIIFTLFLTRKQSQDTSKSIADWGIALATVLFSAMLRPHMSQNTLLGSISMAIQSIGMLLMLLSLISLGRSFGIVPSNRTVKSKGAFQIVRHPLYVSELIYYFGFLMGNCTHINTLLVLGIFIGQFYRASAEEKLLSQDPAYLQYCELVRFRFIPGLY
jgi:protein-S-isoprenylcysteine O-methyltransferase Ste14/uncharacterized membrane protein (UPF0127 family)